MPRRDYPDRPIVGAGAVIIEDDRVVLVRRAREPLRGHWSIPGGMVELGEGLRQASAREAWEETGLEVEVGEVLEVFESIIPSRDPDAGKAQFHYVIIDFLCRRTGGELRAGGDALEVRWVMREELTDYEVTESAAKVIKKAFEAKSGAK